MDAFFTFKKTGSLLAALLLSCLLLQAAPPTITIIGAATIIHQVNTPYNDMGATAIDEKSNDITPFISTTGVVKVDVFGTYILTYTVTDGKGQTATAMRKVIVTDKISPTISSVSGTETMTACANDLSFIEPAVTATDNYFPSVSITRTGSFDITKAGQYTIVYTATDGANNTSTYTRTITVKPCSTPVIITSGNVRRIKLFESIDLLKYVTVMDSYYPPSDFINGTNGCSLKVVSSNVDSSKVGLYQAVYQATNGDGAMSTPSAIMIEVVDNNTTGIAQPMSNTFKVYPNPAGEKLIIDFEVEVTNNYMATLSSVDGKTVLQKNVSSTNNILLLNNLDKGIYVLQITSEDGTETPLRQKIMVR